MAKHLIRGLFIIATVDTDGNELVWSQSLNGFTDSPSMVTVYPKIEDAQRVLTALRQTDWPLAYLLELICDR